MKVTDKITITNEDNMELMARYPDNYFDLAIVDPPYGIMDKIISGGETNRKIKKNMDGKKENQVNGIYLNLLLNILKSCLGCQKIKLFGVEIIFLSI